MENQNEHDSTQDAKENDPNYENCTSCGKPTRKLHPFFSSIVGNKCASCSEKETRDYMKAKWGIE